MSRPRGLRSRRGWGAPRRKPAGGGSPTRCQATISRTLARRRSGSIVQSPNCRKRSLASTPRRISVPRRPRSEKRPLGLETPHGTPPLIGKATALSPPKKGKGGTDRRSSMGLASFLLQATILVRRSGAPPSRYRSRGKLNPCITPITLPVRRPMVMSRDIPMHGHHPDLGSFGKGGPSGQCRTPLRGNAAGCFQVDGGQPTQ
jgi:hypothetical protein